MPIEAANPINGHSPLGEIFGSNIAELGFGGLIGWSVGFFSKKSLKIAAIIIAIAFIGIQAMVYLGYISTPDWERMGSDAGRVINRDLFDSIWDILTASLPFGGGFTAGFILGFKMG